jgi:hypothetical protein
MCRRITCPRCGKPGYAGCGMHIDQVLSDVPVKERCQCPAQEAAHRPEASSGKRGRPWWLR